MGFLSRKKKNPEQVLTEETHPLEEELQGMEEAVPERPVSGYVEPEHEDDGYEDEGAPTAGPVPAERTSSAQGPTPQ